jgi:putative ABC transport system permease protein
MSKLLGIPVSDLAVVLAAVLVIALGAIAALALRNRVFLRMGLRSISRRRGRSALIVTGLMLGTAIIAAALATGDTMEPDDPLFGRLRPRADRRDRRG